MDGVPVDASGNTMDTNGYTPLRADTITVYSTPKGTDANGQPSCGGTDRIVADGNVFYVTPQQNARGDHAVYSKAADEIVITGDVVHHPVQLAVPDWENNFDFDKDAGAKQRRRFFGLYADQPALVIGSHFADPGAGRIVSDGDVWRLEVE